MLHNIPASMLHFNQWICWREEVKIGDAKTKVPYCPQTGMRASNRNPAHWTNFQNAVDILQSGDAYTGLGFVLTHDDPFCFIDLDDCQTQAHVDLHESIAREFHTYQEISPNGGLHLICKASVPAGRNSKATFATEIYSSGRYMTMTGDVYKNAPITMQQANVSALWEYIGSDRKSVTVENMNGTPMLRNDANVYEIASKARNGVKFLDLWNGDWAKYYGSQSEADLALMDILAHYSQNKEQLARMFRQSGLGQRDKAQRDDYLFHPSYGIVTKSFDRILTPLDMTGMMHELEAAREALRSQPIAVERPQQPIYETPKPKPKIDSPAAPTTWEESTVTKPPGLMGLIADFILQSANRPVPEIALAGAIGLMSGVCGRAFNIDGTGLNTYLLIIARTGRGKNAIEEGIGKLFETFAMNFPQTADFQGSGDFSSGPGLITALSNNPLNCFVSIMDEFGLKLNQLSAPKIFGPDLSFKKLLLQLYMASGDGYVFRPTAYADVSRNFAPIDSPSVSILGTSQPEVYYTGLTDHVVKQGLIPRFLTIHYDGKRPRKNKGHNLVKPSAELTQGLSTMFAIVLQGLAARQVVNVQKSPEADAALDEFDLMCDRLCDDKEATIVEDFYTRADLKVLKLASLVAVGINPTFPVIDLQCVEFAKSIVMKDIEILTDKFHAGEVGNSAGEFAQMEQCKRVLVDYLIADYSEIAGYNVAASMHNCGDVPLYFFTRRLSRLAIFRNDMLGPTKSIKRALQNMVDNGDLIRYSQNETRQKYDSDACVFAIKNVELLTKARNIKFAATS